MTWRDKLQITEVALENNPELIMVFSEGEGRVSEQFLSKLASRFPFVDREYQDFLRTVNGLQIDLNVLFGSGENRFPSLDQADKRWRDIVDSSNYLVIGEDASGRCFALSRNGDVWRFEHDPPDQAKAWKVATSIAQFLNDVLMGSRLPELFDGYWGNRVENAWSRHLKDLGWL